MQQCGFLARQACVLLFQAVENTEASTCAMGSLLQSLDVPCCGPCQKPTGYMRTSSQFGDAAELAIASTVQRSIGGGVDIAFLGMLQVVLEVDCNLWGPPVT